MSKSSGSKGRGRNRGGGGKRPQGRGGNFDPNSGRNRGNAQQLMDKYLTLARDAASQGDRIAAENFYQHADHYYRVVYARNEQQEARRRANNNGGSEPGKDPIPVQSVDEVAGPVGLVGADKTANPEAAAKTNGSVQTEQDDVQSAAASEPEEKADAPKPRRGRPPRKAKETPDSPAPEAAE